MRKLTLSLSIAFIIFSCSEPTPVSSGNDMPPATSDSIATGSAVAAGFDTAMLNKLASEISQGVYPNIHSLLIAHDNKLVYEKYWTGADEHWGDPRGDVPHGIDSLHDLRSISKSVVAICAGIAVAQGKIQSVDQKVFDFFPEFKKYDTGKISRLTVKHLLSMSSGLKWNEDVPYDNPENSEIRMTSSPNPVEYVLSQPMDAEPGTVWKYNGGTTQLLAAIIEKTTGLEVADFANRYLFQPLGIAKYEWVKFPGTKLSAAASGLRLRSRDLLKFGLLCYNRGEWKGRQLLPADWIDASFQPQVTRGEDGAYGYQFWLFNDTVDNKPGQLVACVGNGDQRIFFNRDKKLVVVVNAGNYNKWNIPKNSHNMLYTYIYPSLK